MTFLRWFIAWLAAVAVTAAVGSVIQTQLNIARIVELGAEVGIGQRLETTLQDLLGFAPLWAIIVAAGLLVALLTAGGLSRFRPGWSLGLHALAGLAAPLVALLLMEAMMPVTVVAAARTWTGLVLLSLPGAIGGLLYWLVIQRQKGQTFHQAAQRNSSSQAGS
jgi:hypothetical protein